MHHLLNIKRVAYPAREPPAEAVSVGGHQHPTSSRPPSGGAADATGVAVVESGTVVHTVDEPTGGRHLTLVVAGSQGISVEEAEELKRDPRHQRRLAPVLRPVMEKVASIVQVAIRAHDVHTIHLMGGAVMVPDFAEVVAEVTGIPTQVPPHPLLVTPLGIARSAPVPDPTSEEVQHHG